MKNPWVWILLYQLQYAYYKLKGNSHSQTIKAYETMIEDGETRLKEKLSQVVFNIPALEQKITKLTTKLPTIEQETVALNLAKERELIHRETISETLSKKFLANEMDKMSLLTTKIDKALLLSLAYLQKKETQKALNIFNTGMKDIEKLTPELNSYYTYKRTILNALFKEVAGNVALALSNVEQSAESIYDFTSNIDTHIVNKRALEGLVLAGAFDSLKGNRAQNFSSIENALSFGNKVQSANKNQKESLFGDMEESLGVEEPELPDEYDEDDDERLLE